MHVSRELPGVYGSSELSQFYGLLMAEHERCFLTKTGTIKL
jgi:hypothetical protein